MAARWGEIKHDRDSVSQREMSCGWLGRAQMEPCETERAWLDPQEPAWAPPADTAVRDERRAA